MRKKARKNAPQHTLVFVTPTYSCPKLLKVDTDISVVYFHSPTQITSLTVTFLAMSKRTLRTLVSLPLLQSLTVHGIKCRDSEGTGGDEAYQKV